ncbi:indole-3-glycerol phosphate synthase TrpC [Rhodohalobacter mucosus]|uniref:Indole-3-glycerol phosphate synthase n=1 Tax=Rhodohalobacter mucosus TaxID=2079485 RepID=A0A316TUH6_9BACT|nr:indole-3-glycerol phosphate synthase TrpC [Rhodohalobacter mucosus]PWN07508.1 indole-3-glycerol phosphate synthase TrpC [Rhodohalobacter mucosus]
MNILQKITDQTREDLGRRKRKISLRDFESFELYEKPGKSFNDALRKEGSVSVIAEVKKASPSKGIIRRDFDPLHVAEAYVQNGASAISVLTDEPFFKGSLTYLEMISKISPLPLLRKDFIVDPYQVKEARAYGADAVLLIATIYGGNQLSELLSAAKEFQVEALVEFYHENEMNDVNWNEIDIAGVNNRDLSTFDVDLHRGVSLLQKTPDHVVRVSESGIHKPGDLNVLYNNGIHSALIGEHFMRQPDVGEALKKLLAEFEELKSDAYK